MNKYEECAVFINLAVKMVDDASEMDGWVDKFLK
jgi:hypothetical protein